MFGNIQNGTASLIVNCDLNLPVIEDTCEFQVETTYL